jgi:hypothetical protein
MTAQGVELRPRLAQMGLPAIVVANLDLSHGDYSIFPSLAKPFVTQILEPASAGANIYLRAGVSPGQIEDIWQPGHPEYDKIPGLPRT